MSEPVLFTTVTYLESNVWAALTIHPNRDALTALLKSQRMIVASTVTAAELLRAPAGKRERLGKTFCDLVTLPLLEPPLVLTEAAARAVVNCETEYEMRPVTKPEQSMQRCAAIPTRTCRASQSGL